MCILIFAIHCFLLFQPIALESKTVTHLSQISNYSLTAKYQHHRIYLSGDFTQLKYGDQLQLLDLTCHQTQNSYDNHISFNFFTYLLAHHQIITCETNEFLVSNHHSGPINFLRNLNLFMIDTFSNVPLITSLIFGAKNDAYTNLYANTGVSHLFVISGTHVAVIILFITNIISIFTNSYRRQQQLLVTALISYAFLSGFNIPVIRVIALYLLNEFFPEYQWFKITLLLICLYNPFISYNYSFILSYLISYYIITFLNHQAGFKTFFFTNFELFFFTLPIQIKFNHSVNVMTPLINCLLIPFFSIFVIPLAIITCLFPIQLLIEALNLIFLFIIHFLELLERYQIYIGQFNLLVITLYYFCFYLLKKREYSLNLALVLGILCVSFTLKQNQQQVCFIDGPSPNIVVVKSPWHNILINCGDEYFNQELITYLKSKQIYHFDALILTDESLLEQSQDITNVFKTDMLISPSDFSDFSYNTSKYQINGNFKEEIKFSSSKLNFIYSNEIQNKALDNTIYITDNCTSLGLSQQFSISNTCVHNEEYTNYNPNLHGVLELDM